MKTIKKLTDEQILEINNKFKDDYVHNDDCEELSGNYNIGFIRQINKYVKCIKLIDINKYGCRGYAHYVTKKSYAPKGFMEFVENIDLFILNKKLQENLKNNEIIIKRNKI